MPLSTVRGPKTKNRCRKNVSENVSKLMREGRPQAQAVAIALDVARRSGCSIPDTRGRSSGKKPKGTPTDLNLYTLFSELERHHGLEAALGLSPKSTGPLYQFQPTSISGVRRLVDAGYLVPSFDQVRGHWDVSGEGMLALEGWRQRNRGYYGIPASIEGRSVGALVVLTAVLVGAALLLRPVFADSFERHKWSMQHDPAYRRSHEAMEYAAGARGVLDVLGGMGSRDGRASGRTAPRDKIVEILEQHFARGPAYRGLDRDKLFMVSVELLDQGASATDALALTHALALSPSARKKTERSTPKATAHAILAGKVKLGAPPGRASGTFDGFDLFDDASDGEQRMHADDLQRTLGPFHPHPASRLLSGKALDLLSSPSVLHYVKARAWAVEVKPGVDLQKAGPALRRALVGKRSLAMSDPMLHDMTLHVVGPKSVAIFEPRR